MTQINKNFNTEVDNIVKTLLESKNKDMQNITPETKLSDIFDYVDTRRLSFEIDKVFKINSHANIEHIVTLQDLYNTVNDLINQKESKKLKSPYVNKELNNKVNRIIINMFRQKGKHVPLFTAETKLSDIFDYLDIRRVSFEIDKVFKINSHAFIEEMDTIKDLYNVTSNLIYRKGLTYVDHILHPEETQSKKLSTKERLWKKRKEQVFVEISDMIKDAWIVDWSYGADINMNTKIDPMFHRADFDVLKVIDEKYNINIAEHFDDSIKTVGDLCDLIVKQRIAKFNTDKRLYNNDVKFESKPLIIHVKPLRLQYYGPYIFMGINPPLSVRVKYNLARIKQRLSR